jgi:hypothetical protein
MKITNDTIGNRSRDLPVCSTVPQPLRNRVPLENNVSKVKFTLEQATKAHRGGGGGICTHSLTSALDGVGGQPHALATLPPGKTRYPL